MFRLHLSPSDNHGYVPEEGEQLASEGTGFRDGRTAPEADFYAGSNFGSSDLEGRYPVALSSASSAAIDTPTLTVQCREDGFQIALRAGSLNDVRIKGMCPCARPHAPTPPQIQN